MSFVEIFTLFASGVTIFGLIVGLFSVYNGRMTRRELSALIRDTQTETQRLIRETHTETVALIRETHELMAREAEAARQLLQQMSRETQELIAREAEAARHILQGITEILGRIDERVR